MPPPLPPQAFDASDLLQGEDFSKVLSSLVVLNKATAGLEVTPFNPQLFQVDLKVLDVN